MNLSLAPIRIGSRGSKLAIIQAEEVKLRLQQAWSELLAPGAIQIVQITTAGDWRPEHKERTFTSMGGNKSWFTKELQDALMAERIDIAVHSLKDVETRATDALKLSAVLPRADARDAFISKLAPSLDELPEGAVVGTASARRSAQIIARRPDLKIVPFRGNVDTRLRKLANGDVDAAILALSGMQRLGLVQEVTSIVEPEVILPAAGQGAIAVEIRRKDERCNTYTQAINDPRSWAPVTAERGFLRALDGSCSTPIGAHARWIDDATLRLDGLVARPDGSDLMRVDATGPAADAARMGEALGKSLRAKLPSGFFKAA
ncbi:MAG: hydroxymethylbilane synthase [Alphaproteobacteria bacterium]|nr:hydroxymethylbilane synthase [Alphaproteobacteria bacterium]